MFVNKLFIYIMSACKRCVNVKSSTYCLHVKTKILADFQICICVTLKVCTEKRNTLKLNSEFTYFFQVSVFSILKSRS